jgi:hypothetical protein
MVHAKSMDLLGKGTVLIRSNLSGDETGQADLSFGAADDVRV